MSKPLIVIGAGGHARVLIDALILGGQQILGVTDVHPNQVDRAKLRVPILGTDEVIDQHGIGSVCLVNGLGQIRVGSKRAKLFAHFKGKGYTFAPVIHPSAVIAADVQIGEGVQVMAGAVIQTGSVIGHNTIINTRASVDHDCVIGEHVHLAPGVVLSGEVTVGNGSHLGTGAVIVQGVHLKSESFIKANEMVYKSSEASVRHE